MYLSAGVKKQTSDGCEDDADREEKGKHSLGRENGSVGCMSAIRRRENAMMARDCLLPCLQALLPKRGVYLRKLPSVSWDRRWAGARRGARPRCRAARALMHCSRAQLTGWATALLLLVCAVA